MRIGRTPAYKLNAIRNSSCGMISVPSELRISASHRAKKHGVRPLAGYERRFGKRNAAAFVKNCPGIVSR